MDNIYDDQFKGIISLQWLPWVGKNYIKSPEGNRLLLLGESHYLPSDDDEDFYKDSTWTRKFISKEGLKELPWYVGGSINPLIINTERTIYKIKNITDENKKKLWDSVVFFNLVQRLLLSRNKEHRPVDDDYDKGWEVFFNLVEIIKPNICIVLGMSGVGRLGHYLNNNNTEWERKVSEFYTKEKIITLIKDDHKLKLIFIKHPSSFFSWKRWGEFIDKHIKEHPILLNNMSL